MLSNERFVGVASKISQIMDLDSNFELAKIPSDHVCSFIISNKVLHLPCRILVALPHGRCGAGLQKYNKIKYPINVIDVIYRSKVLIPRKRWPNNPLFLAISF